MSRSAPEVSRSTLEAERVVIAGILMDPERIHGIADLVAPEDFSQPEARKLFTVLLAIVKNRPQGTVNLEYYARVVHEKAMLRRLIQEARDTQEQALLRGTE